MMMTISVRAPTCVYFEALAEHNHCRRYYSGHPKLARSRRLGLSIPACVHSEPQEWESRQEVCRRWRIRGY
jgi:hypothetical protein